MSQPRSTSNVTLMYPPANGTSPIPDRARYRLGARMGRSGNVYEARSANFENALALKLLPFESPLPPAAVAAFIRESDAVAALGDPHIMRVLNAGQFTKGTPFVAMEMMTGEILADLIGDRKALPPDEVRVLIRDLASALSAAHAVGVVHGDVCADNVFMASIPGRPFALAQLMDFGVSRLTTATGRATHLAPEQKRVRPAPDASIAALDPRTDQYALAALTYRLLTGVESPPEDSAQSAFERLREVRPRPIVFPVRCATEIEAVLSKALQRRPEARYRSIVAYFNAFQKALEGSSQGSDFFDQTHDTPMSVLPTWGSQLVPANIVASHSVEAISPSLTQEFFLVGERNEAAEWDGSPLLEEREPDPEAAFHSFDRVPKRRGPLLVASLLVAIGVGVGAERVFGIPSEARTWVDARITNPAWTRIQRYWPTQAAPAVAPRPTIAAVAPPSSPPSALVVPLTPLGDDAPARAAAPNQSIAAANVREASPQPENEHAEVATVEAEKPKTREPATEPKTARTSRHAVARRGYVWSPRQRGVVDLITVPADSGPPPSDRVPDALPPPTDPKPLDDIPELPAPVIPEPLPPTSP